MDIRRVALAVFGLGLMVAGASLSIWLLWGHPDMTRRRLLLEFPIQTIAASLVCVAGSIAIRAAGRP